jgi:2'-5' RNA ligase
MARLFFALWPESRARADLNAAAHAVSIPEGRRVTAENLHITLLFLGQVAEKTVPALIEVGGRIRGTPFCLELTESGWWPRPKVVWLAPATVPTALVELAAELREQVSLLGLKLEQRAYRPHLTIARKVPRKPAASTGLCVPWMIAGFALIQSVTAAAGVRYEVLRQWPLAHSAGNTG